MKKLICAALVAACAAGTVVSVGCSGEATVNYTLSEDGTYYAVGGVSGNNRALTSYDVPAEYAEEEGGKPLPVKEIGEFAFFTCQSLRAVTLPDTIVSIKRNAFSYCGFSSFEIPDGVQFIGYGAFGKCDSLKEITIPESVTEMEGHAFYGCSSLEKVYIKANIEVIPENAFSNFAYAEAGNVIINSALTEVYMSSSVKKIYATAFSNNFYLSDIYFAGTEEQWNAVGFFRYEIKEGTEDELEEIAMTKSEVLGDKVNIHFNAEF